jgi:WD40 repeat protein
VWDVTQNVELRTLGGGADENYVDPVAGVAFSPDGKLLVSGYVSGLVTVWDALSGQQLHTLRVSESRDADVVSLELSPDGKILAVATFDGTVSILDSTIGAEVSFWDTTSWENIRTLSLPGDSMIFGSGMVFSPVGDILVIGSDTTLLLDAASGKQLIALSIISSGLAFSPDGNILITAGHDGAIHVWGLAPSDTTQEEPSTVVPGGGITIIQEPTLTAIPEKLNVEKEPIPLLLSAEGIQAGEWSPDGKYFYYSQ